MKKECKDHLGNVYASTSDMCRFYKVKRKIYDYRISHGWTVQDALSAPGNPHNKDVTDHLGNTYKSIVDMCKAYNVTVNAFKGRIRKKYSLQDALTTPVGTKSAHWCECTDHLGISHKSIKDMCLTYGITDNIFHQRISRGWTIQDVLTTPIGQNSKECRDHLGNTYDSIKDMCRFYKVNKKTFKDRLSSGWTLQDALTVSVGDRSAGWHKCTDHLGNTYNSIRDMCRAYNIPVHVFYGRTSLGWTLREILELPRNMYIGEYRVAEALKRLNVTFYHDVSLKTIFKDLHVNIDWTEFSNELQKRFGAAGINWTKQRIAKLRPDFVLYTDEDKRIRGVIEFDGEQHMNYVELFFKTVEKFLQRSNADEVKDTLWEHLNIPMLRIRYDQVDRIDDMVTDLVQNPEKYITRHNTYLSEEEYWEPLKETKAQLELAFA